MAVFVPILVWPGTFLITQRVAAKQQERLEGTVYRWAVSGPEADSLRQLVAQAEAAGPAEAAAPLGKPASFGLEEVTPPPADYLAAIDEGSLHLFVEALPAGTLTTAPDPARATPRGRSSGAGRNGDGDRDTAPRQPNDAVRQENAAARQEDEKARQSGAAARQERPSGEPDTAAGPSGGPQPPVPSPVPLYRVHFREDRDLSREAFGRLEGALARANDLRRERLLLGRGFPARPSELGAIETKDLASEAESTGLQLGRFISALLVSMLIAGGSVVASDTLAGEKERGTLETLLTTAVSRAEIVVAKQLSILLVALAMTALQLGAIWFYIGSGLIELPASVDLHLTPGRALLLFVLYLPVAALIASGLLIASAYSKSYKEAQLYFLPAFVLGIAPTLAAIIPGATLRSVLLLVPIANISMAVKDILAGTPDPLLTAVAWLITAGTAAALAAVSARLLSKESLLTSVQLEPSWALGGVEPFRRDVLRWTAAAWALIVVASLFMGTGEHILERQLAFNMTLLLALTVFLLRRYRLSPRQTLSLRAPRPMAWVAVLLGAPSALVVGQMLFRATSRFLPVPEEALREFVEQILPADAPWWKLALLLVVIPAVVEEIFFRGIVLNGLSGRRVAVAVLGSALAFGIYHVSFFRLLPTAFLGVLLALTTLWSGSIFPSMLWHALNNGIAAFAVDDAETLPTWVWIAAPPLLVIALFLLWRSRGHR
jgi:sodium transport system permease protein